jgi:hypothetical protein
VAKLRAALADSADAPRFVETLHRRGYRFICPVGSATQAPVAAATGNVKPAQEPKRFLAAAVFSSAAVALALLASAWWFLHHRAHKLTDKDTVVLADFMNSTGDPVFDGTLRQGLAVQLSQSPFLSLISEERVKQTLQLMSQPPDARLTPEIARQVCLRNASAAVLEGSIAKLGSQYVLGLNAVNCATGDSLAEEQVTAEGKEHAV